MCTCTWCTLVPRTTPTLRTPLACWCSGEQCWCKRRGRGQVLHLALPLGYYAYHAYRTYRTLLVLPLALSFARSFSLSLSVCFVSHTHTLSLSCFLVLSLSVCLSLCVCLAEDVYVACSFFRSAPLAISLVCNAALSTSDQWPVTSGQ